MLRLRAPNPAEVLTLAYFKHSWKGIRKARFGVTAMLSYEQVQDPGEQSVGQAAQFCLGARLLERELGLRPDVRIFPGSPLQFRTRIDLQRRKLFSGPCCHCPPKAKVTRSNRVGCASLARSVPDTWVTVYTGDIGNTLVVSCHRRALTKPPARYGAKGARFASGFVSRRSCIRTRDGIQ
jgi:hypothetical protein